MTDRKQLIDNMVTRFLAWRLPETFAPDAGISFTHNGKGPVPRRADMPVGTNLFSAAEAEEMIRYILAEDELPGDGSEKVRELIDKAAKSGMPDEAMKFAQAALNAANALVTIAK